MDVDICIDTDMDVDICTDTDMDVDICIDMHVCTCMYVHTYMSIHTSIHIFGTYPCASTHMSAHVCAPHFYTYDLDLTWTCRIHIITSSFYVAGYLWPLVHPSSS